MKSRKEMIQEVRRNNLMDQERRQATAPPPVKTHWVEERSSPCSMGIQYRVVSNKGHTGPWVENSKSEAWRRYKAMRRSEEGNAT